MGANATQALAICLFLIAFVVLAAGMAMNGDIFLILAAFAPLAISVALFRIARILAETEG